MMKKGPIGFCVIPDPAEAYPVNPVSPVQISTQPEVCWCRFHASSGAVESPVWP